MSLALFVDALARDPTWFVTVVLVVVISIVLHELGHGFAALWQGDDTPRVTGHITLNPLVHMGGFSLLLLLVAGIAYGQMPVNPHRFRSRFGQALVAFAGPAVNILLAGLGLTAWVLWLKFGGPAEAGTLAARGQTFLLTLGYLNIVLCLFNLLPVPPLDGSTVLANFSPGYRRLVSNAEYQPLFMGAFILVFFFSERIFALALSVAAAYKTLVVG